MELLIASLFGKANEIKPQNEVLGQKVRLNNLWQTTIFWRENEICRILVGVITYRGLLQ